MEHGRQKEKGKGGEHQAMPVCGHVTVLCVKEGMKENAKET
jgi:hypothetical protein